MTVSLTETTGAFVAPVELKIIAAVYSPIGSPLFTITLTGTAFPPLDSVLPEDGLTEIVIPKIVDFGTVATKEATTTLTQTGGILLTAPYAAPEQWRAVPALDLDGRTDLFANLS